MTEPPDAPYDPNDEPPPHDPVAAYHTPPSYAAPYQPPSYAAPPSESAQQGDWEHLGPALPKARRSRRASLIAAVASVAVIGGGTATYVAVSDSHSGFKGAASPQEAVASLASDLQKADLLGVLDHLVPAERSALLGPLTESIRQAKRLHVVKGLADPSRLTGVEVTARDIRYDTPPDEVINDHVHVVKLVGGTITVNSDLSKVPFTDQLLKAVFPGGVVPSNTKSTNTLDIASAVPDNGPVRIATQKVGGKWYPSLLYTIADDAVQEDGVGNPTASDYIAPKGAPTAEDAVKQAVLAISTRDYNRLIELAAPEELQVVHDYGGVILDNLGPDSGTPFTVKDLQLVSKKVSGATRVGLKSITVDVPDHETTVAINGDCAEITADGDYRKYCADQLVKQLNTGLLRDKPLTSDEAAAFGRLARGLANVGVDVISSDGQWYLSPLRSYLDGINALLEPLRDNDLIVLLTFVNR